MNKLWFALATLLVLGLSAGTAAADDDHKITICHKGQDITVDVHAVPAHLDHGDNPIPCEQVANPPCACGQDWDPVLCTLPDGSTKLFANQCFATCAGARNCQPFSAGGIGACSDIFNPVTCVLPDGSTKTFANICQARLGGCQGPFNLLCACGTIYLPVRCGDGKIYVNACVAACFGHEVGCTPLQ
jgi:hypothetical protein